MRTILALGLVATAVWAVALVVLAVWLVGEL
jgi:hypothetical protein